MIRKIAKAIVPSLIWNRLGGIRRNWVTRDDEKLTTREVFSRIYQKRIWTGDEGYSSGTGSRNISIVEPYLDIVKQWAQTHSSENLTALDLGCGDFHVGSCIYPLFKKYIAADIVPVLVESHRKKHVASNLEFQCIDGIDDSLPAADVIFVRQVLQHLSNDQILKIIPKLYQFQHAIISEHIPTASQLKVKNTDKIHGGGIRLGQNSGIYLEAYPFLLRTIEATVLLEVPAGPDAVRDGLIVTTHYRLK